jgi:hypothetical protein
MLKTEAEFSDITQPKIKLLLNAVNVSIVNTTVAVVPEPE